MGRVGLQYKDGCTQCLVPQAKSIISCAFADLYRVGIASVLFAERGWSKRQWWRYINDFKWLPFGKFQTFAAGAKKPTSGSASLPKLSEENAQFVDKSCRLLERGEVTALL